MSSTQTGIEDNVNDNNNSNNKESNQNTEINDPISSSTSTSSPTKQSHHFAQAQFITSVNRDCGTSTAAANIDKIIEEEEDEEAEQEEQEEETEEPTVLENKIEQSIDCQQSKSSQTEEKTPVTSPLVVEVKGETTKFILETVVLDKELNIGSKPVAVDTSKPNPIDSNQSETQSQPLLIGGLFTVNKIDDSQLQASEAKSADNVSEQIEIRVEEGYATRQMDEYFRQTIAAIKEELTKKLNNEKKDQTNNNQLKRGDNNKDVIDDYDSDEEFDSDDYEWGDDDFMDSSYDADPENSKSKRFKSPNQLYHHLINSNIAECREQSQFEKIAGWLVVFGCILNQFIIDGLCFNYANLFDLIQKDFKIKSRLISSMPAALLICLYLAFAPISVFLTKTYGTRRIALIGSFISAVSLLISSFLKNIVFFTLFYGIFTGVGISLIYVSGLISISKWFLKRRLLVNSLTILGACAGAAVYPVLSEFLTTKYTLNGALLVLSGIQFNCLLGSMFLREPAASVPLSLFGRTKRHVRTKKNGDSITEPNSLKRSKLNHMKNRSSSSTHLIENDETNYKEEQIKSTKLSNDIEMTSTKHTSKYKKLDPSMSPKRSNPRGRKIDSETESTTSTSTTTITNYTIKQYWRKFVQTRKSQANTKKNLFHLIAEEKKKTRTLSKTSLEDGFVITTSNNLLAPNDESHVIITSRQAKLAQQNAASAGTQQPITTTSRAASRFFTRIANSIRSLGQSNQNQSPLHTTTHSKNQLDSTRNTSVLDFVNNKQIAVVQLSEKSTINAVDSPSNTKKTQPEVQPIPSAVSNVSSATPLPLIPLMSVFSGPLPPETLQQPASVPVSSSEPVIDNAESIAHQANNNSANQNVEENSNQTQEELNRYDEVDDDDEEDYYEENELDDKEIQAHKSQLSRKLNSTSNNPNSNVYKMSRYLSYRNSLTNSVRGSLLECSVPEDREEHESVSNGNDMNDEELNNKQLDSHRNSSKRRMQRMQEANKNNSSLSPVKSGSDHVGSNNVKYLMNGRNNNSGFRATFISARRLISTIDSASFFNLPLNLETIENNIKNSFIVKKSSYYQRNQYQNKTPIYYSSETKNTSTLFLLYLGYITNFKVFLNPLLMILNFAFFLNIIGICVPLIYISEFCMKQGINKIQSLYILGLIGLSQGIGRIVSTIIYKVNESNPKSRIFAHDLTLILAGLSVLLSTILCDTPFSCCVFAIAFGSLFGFNASLRSLFIYDIIGLEWSDDSLFCCVSLAQAIGASIGIPIAGLIYDITQNYLNVFYFSGVCLIMSGIILTPGRNFQSHCSSSLKRLNRYYFQRR